MSTPFRPLASISQTRFRSIVGSLSRRHETDLLLSGPGPDPEQRSFVGLDVKSRLVIDAGTEPHHLKQFVLGDGLPTFGYLAYDYGERWRGLGVRREHQLPLGLLKKYHCVIRYDHNTGELAAIGEGCHDRISNVVNHAIEALPDPKPVHGRLIEQTLDRSEYIDRVTRVLEYIRDGDIYQMCLSTRFTYELTSRPGIEHLMQLASRYPAPYYAWFDAGEYDILSTSPEQFLRVHDRQVQSQPIKGTLAFEAYNDSLRAQLSESPKEDAELSMIVDLIRNDISMNCVHGSVEVPSHKDIMIVDNLLQMYSTVTGRLREDRDCIDLLLDAFPGGSVTGCPKSRAMELIRELEPHAREVYCGSLFVILGEGDMEASVAIRTGYVDRGRSLLRLYAGSGIVVDSVPEREYAETMAKAGKFFAALEG